VKPSVQFAWTSRLLHWLMAALLVAMFFIGVSMVSSLSAYHRLLSLHRPLGIAILALAVLRVVNRKLYPPPDFLPTVSPREQVLVIWSERLLYTLMFALPLVGWGMLSAARYPVVVLGAFHLPPILPQSAGLYTWLRSAHTLLAYLFFATFLAHLGGVLFHTLVVRDGLILRMAPWRAAPGRASAPESEAKEPR
jgi:cytochrome b561